MKKYSFVVLCCVLLTNCATQKTKYAQEFVNTESFDTKEVAHTIYLIGDAGLSENSKPNKALRLFKIKLNKAYAQSTAIFLGDNIYPAGLPDKKDSSKEYKKAKSYLDAQISTLENFEGKPIFIPGNHDWYSDGLNGLKRQEKYIEKKLKQKKPFLPQNGCPITQVKVNEKLVIIVIDTEWYLTNWNKHPTINDNCEIKSRAQFWEEVESVIKKNRDKTTLIAMHHPMFSYGPHGGQFSIKQQLFQGQSSFPLPVLGSLVNYLRKTSGASPEDIQNKRYTEFKNRMVTLAQYSEKVIFASGHEHALQYIVEQNTPQIVSGAGAKNGVSRLINGSQFATGTMGYTELKIFEDGSSQANFFGVEIEGQEELLFTTQVLAPDRKALGKKYTMKHPAEVSASIYTKEEINKTGFFKTIWGERYRKYYGKKVNAPTVNLDTLFGGLKPVRKGGGHQSKSLRLRHENGKEYVMRALRKVSELYLQSMVFQEQYVMDDLEDTFLQKLLADFYTGSHPYAPFTIGDLSDAVGLYHTNPKLYYIPKQSALQDFNKEFGDELYMIEEHAGDGHEDLASYGYSKKLISTDEMLENLRDDERYEVDAEMYLRARLFDMAIGDWDRHVDQWRWAEFKNVTVERKGKKSKKTIYRPVPRDRDQAFSIMGDGLFMNMATRLVPGLRLMEGFKDEIRSVEGFNSSPKTYVLDMAVLSETQKEEWLEEANYIQENLTPEVIDKAFLNFPKEVRDHTVKELKRVLLSRIKNINNTAEEYFKVLNWHAIVVGTDKDDWFEIKNLSKEETVVRVYRKINGKKKKKYFEKIFYHNDTKELWLYGLDDKDIFEILGNQKSKIKIRLIGGQNDDEYIVSNGGQNVRIYDYKSKKNTIKSVSKAKVRLTNQYSTNTYQPLKIRNSFNQLLPVIGFNPDSGLNLGFNNTYTYNGFEQNPFTQQHSLNAAYYFATSGFEANYKGEFANFIGKANFEFKAGFTTPNFATNFFGLGNDTANVDDTLGIDYNRVRLGTVMFSPSLVWRGQLKSKVKIGLSYEAIEVEATEGRFISSFNANNIETKKIFMGVHADYSYANYDNESFPTLGMSTELQIGYKTETSGSGSFGYIVPSLSFDYKLNSSGRLVLATKWKAHFNIGDGFEFYQGAAIGGVDGLRGFRNERFIGKKSYYQNTDIRLSLGQKRTGILPAALGIYAGFDYGRVWLKNENSNTWHTSYGGGVFYNAAGIATLRTSAFNSVDGIRFAFGLGFGF